MCILLLSDLVFSNSSFWVKKSARCEQLHFAYPHEIVVESCRAADKNQENLSVPARYSPFFYAAMPINSSDKDMLMTVQGIGPVLAKDIVTYRRHSGPFTSSDDLLRLPGVGPKRAAKFAAEFTFAETP
jgi:DNA uptake protein ComE-like DNA-binding protein